MFGWKKLSKEEAERIFNYIDNAKEGRLSAREGKWGKKYGPGPEEFIQAKVNFKWDKEHGICVTLITQNILILNKKKPETSIRQMVTYAYTYYIKI